MSLFKCQMVEFQRLAQGSTAHAPFLVPSQGSTTWDPWHMPVLVEHDLVHETSGNWIMVHPIDQTHSQQKDITVKHHKKCSLLIKKTMQQPQQPWCTAWFPLAPVIGHDTIRQLIDLHPGQHRSECILRTAASRHPICSEAPKFTSCSSKQVSCLTK